MLGIFQKKKAEQPSEKAGVTDSLASGTTSGAASLVEINFNGRIHGHSGSNQARRAKTRKAARQGTASIEWRSSGWESFGRFNEQGTQSGKEACYVCCRQSEDRESYQEAVGEVSGAEEESGRIMIRR
jgi:hypothetical protein